MVEDIEAGDAFGQLSMDLLHRMDVREWDCKIVSIVNTFITHWRRHVRDTVAPLRAAYYRGLEIGDLQFAGYAAFCSCTFMYLPGIGKSLGELLPEILALSETIRQARQDTVHQHFLILLQALHDLREGRAHAGLLQGAHYDESIMMPRLVAANDGNGIFYVHFHKLLLSFLFGDYERAVDDSSRVAAYLDNAMGLPFLPVYCLYDSLARLAAYRQSRKVSPEDLRRRVAANQEKLAAWARHAPMNCQYKTDLVEAELQRTFGDRELALAAYDRAIAGARDNGYRRDEAVANELAAGFLLDRGMESLAHPFLREAHSCYARWGATAKAVALERRFPALRLGAQKETRAEGEADASAASLPPLLDLATVIKSSQAIAGEIELPRLLDRLMRIAIQNAGAERAALLLDRGGDWAIEAEGDVNEGRFDVLTGISLPRSDMVPEAIVRAVARDRTNVVLDDAARAGPFVDDPRVRQRAIKSVICAPLVNQGRLSGILYLENNLVAGAFTPGRLSLINLLLAQMALSLDNARLFQQAQREIAERRAAEETLRESEEKFRSLVESSLIGIFTIDDGFRFIYVNDIMCDLIGRPREDLMGMDFRAFLTPAYQSLVADRYVRRQRGETLPPRYEIVIQRLDGRQRWVEMSVTIVQDPAGRPRTMGQMVDITERKEAETHIRQLNEELERRVRERTAQLESANRELESFSYSVSHDLRAPLRAIDGFTRILVEDHAESLDAEGRRLCSVVQENTRRMAALIDDLLAFSRVGRREMQTATIDMNALVRSVIDELLTPDSAARIDLRLPALPPAEGDPTLLRQVWINLLSNALKFSSRRARAVIEVGFAYAGNEVVYSVRDNGAGFDMRDAGKLFGVFRRLHGEREFEGTGVGLAIVQRVIQRHGGRAWGEGEIDRGATFSFTLRKRLP